MGFRALVGGRYKSLHLPTFFMPEPNAAPGLDSLVRPCELDSTRASLPTAAEAVEVSTHVLVLFGPVSLVSSLQKLLSEFGDSHGLPVPRFRGASTRHMSLDLVQYELVQASAEFAWLVTRQLVHVLPSASQKPLYPQCVGVLMAHHAELRLALDKQEPLRVSCTDTRAALQLLKGFVDAAAHAGAHLHELEPDWLSAMASRFLPKSST